jgi:hypothetical protein
VAEVISGEVDVFARVEHVNGGRVTENVDVAAIRWKSGLSRVEAEEILNPALPEPSLETDEERLLLVIPALEVLAQQRKQALEDRSLSR